MTEYNKLKAKAGKKSAALTQQLERVRMAVLRLQTLIHSNFVLDSATQVHSCLPHKHHLLILVFPISNKQSSDCGHKYFFLSLSSSHHSPLVLPPTLLQVKHEQRTDEDALGQARMKKQELTNREQQLREQRWD